jgi:putative transposase
VDDAYSRYYNKQNDAPRFKSKKNKLQSYTTKMVNNNIEIQKNYVKLPKVGWVKFAKSREIEGRILSATIRQNPSGQYFISIKTEVNIEPLPKTGKKVGMDMGLKYFAVPSNEDAPIRNPKWFYKLEEKLAKAQRVLSRRSQGSTNWYKQKKKVAKIHEDIVNARTDYLGKISFNLVKNHDLIALEDLKVANMVKNHHLAKAITEVSWAEFRAMLEYKAKWYGKKVIAVNPQYTSQTCNQCGHVSNKNRKTQSDFECVSCGHKDNADRNASKNILTLALKQVTVAW